MVTRFKEGDRVAVGAITPGWGSGTAQASHSLQSGGPLGGVKFTNIKDRTFAEYVHVNEADANLALIPDGVPDEAAVYVYDMMSTGFMAAENARVPIGGTVAIFAQGPVGLMCSAGARLQGAVYLIAVETIPKRKELARNFGADEVLDFTKTDVVQRILDLTDGEGLDSSIEAFGASKIFG